MSKQYPIGGSGGGGGSGTVTSVGATSTGGTVTITGSPVTTAGNINFDIIGTVARIPYYDAATGLLTSDANFTRDNSNFGATRIRSVPGNGALSQLLIESSNSVIQYTNFNGSESKIEFLGDSLVITNNSIGWSWAIADGTAGQALVTDGAGGLSFSSAVGQVYPDQEIVFGNGSTAGGTTDSNLTFNNGDFFAVGGLFSSQGIVSQPSVGYYLFGGHESGFNGVELEIDDASDTFHITNAAGGGVYFAGAASAGLGAIVGLGIDILNSTYYLGDDAGGNINVSPAILTLQTAALGFAVSTAAGEFQFNGSPIIRYGTVPIDYSATNAVGFWKNGGTGVISYIDFITPVGTTYTPTLTNTTNVTSSTAANCQYTRTGNIVTVFGSVAVTTTLAVATVLGISLPIASNLGGATDLNGVAQSSSAITANAYLEGDGTNDRASLKFIGLSVGGAGTVYFSFSYTVI